MVNDIHISGICQKVWNVAIVVLLLRNAAPLGSTASSEILLESVGDKFDRKEKSHGGRAEQSTGTESSSGL